MIWIAPTVVLIVLGALLVATRQEHGSGAGSAYAKQPALFTPAERSFLGVLDLAPESGIDRSGRQTALNRINHKHFDFVPCDPDNLAVLCAIELNDASHQRKDRLEVLMRSTSKASQTPRRVAARHVYY